jgi:hypothetical protein
MANHIDIFDTSNYPRDHFLYNSKNHRVPGKMKDEASGRIINEFCGLRSKMYSLMMYDDDYNKRIEKKTAKGISRYVTQKIKHDQYKQCLFEKEELMIHMNQIRSFQHKLFSVTQHKLGLSPYDDKRYILNDGVTTMAYGHYMIPPHHC